MLPLESTQHSVKASHLIQSKIQSSFCNSEASNMSLLFPLLPHFLPYFLSHCSSHPGLVLLQIAKQSAPLRGWFTSGLTLSVVHSVELYICIMTCIHDYRITHSNFTALIILYALPIHSSHSKSLATTDPFIVCIVLEHNIVGNTQSVAFQVGFFCLITCI